MQAFYITEPGQHRVQDISEPKAGPGEVLLQTRLIGLCGTDLSTFLGRNPLVSYPRIPGHEIAATVLETGPDVPEQIYAGKNVAVYPNTNCGACAACRNGRTNACKFNQTMGVQRDGALCNVFVAPWKKLYASDDLSLTELTMVEPLAVGYHSVVRGRVTEQDYVAVIGCGMVGLGAIAAAADKKSQVIAIDVDDHKLAIARRAGATHVINTRTQDVHEALLLVTRGLGPDVVIEAVGRPETYTIAVNEVAYTGRVVYIGWSKAPVTFETRHFVHKELDIMGSRNSLTEWPAVIDLLAQRKFPVEETISAVVPLADAGDALQKWSLSPESFTKILVEVTA